MASTRVKTFKIELTFTEDEFDLDKLTESYVAEILRRTKVVSKGVSAIVTEIGVSEA
jgi:hypothetical protein